MMERLGITFKVGSDPTQHVVRAFGVQNPDTQSLALHAVYIVGTDGRVVYRKVASRRPTAEELLDAIDAHRGEYPRNDPPIAADRIAVAWPRNNYQALIEIANVEALPTAVDQAALEAVMALRSGGRWDDATMAFRDLSRGSEASLEDLLQAVAWMTRQLFIADN